MLRSDEAGQFSTYPIQNIDIPDLAVLYVDMLDIISKISNYRYSSRAKAVSLKKINIYSLCLTTHGVYVNLSLKGAITF